MILAAGFAAGVYGTNELVTRLTSASRGTRQYLAAVVFVAVVVALAWALRRLQERRII